MMRKQFAEGFTLIEMVVTMLVFSIIMGIAIPSYRALIQKSNRADAIAALSNDQALIERCYAQNFSYSAACASRPTYPHNSTQAFYSIAISNLTATTFTLTATPLGAQVNDTSCANIILDQSNTKTATDSDGSSQSVCWNL